MIESNGLAERAKNYRMNTIDITGTDTKTPLLFISV